MTNIQSLPNLTFLTVDSCRIQYLAILCPLVMNIKYLDVSIWDFPNQQQLYLTEKF